MAEESANGVGARAGLGPFVAVLVVALLGVAFSVDLVATHVEARASGPGTAWCDQSAGVSCSAVSLNRWATVLGVPTAAWGLLAYAGFVILAVAGLRRQAFPRGPGGLLLAASVPALLFGGFLAYVMVVEVEALCPSCLGLDGVNVALVVCALLAVRGRGPLGALKDDLSVLTSNRRVGLAVVGGPLLAGLLVLLAYPRESAEAGPQLPPGTMPELPDAGTVAEPIRTDGIPCLGPEDALVVIHEFSDYQCPYCRRAHHEVRGVVERLEGRVRFCHFQHPLDMACNPRVERPFHPAACLAAAAAMGAQDQGKFWEASDLLYQNARRIDHALIRRIARSLGLDEDRVMSCIESDATRERIVRELALAHAVPVEGTPTFVVNGRIIPGALSAEDFEAVVRFLLDNRGRWPAAPARGREPRESATGRER